MTLSIAMKLHSFPPLLKCLAAAFILAASTTGVALAQAEIAVEQPASTNLIDGSAIIDFGSVNLGSPSTAKTFTIKNTGDAVLNVTAIANSTGATSAFAITATLPMAIPITTGTATFTVVYTPTAGGSQTTNLRITSNDSDESPFNITLNGTGLAPDIVVEEGPANTNYTSGSNYDFGSQSVASGSVVKTFRIENAGGADLTGLSVSVATGNTSDFTITQPAVTSVAAAGNPFTTFTVAFDPSVVGNRVTVLSISSNDPDENPFTLNLKGLGTEPAMDVTQAPSTAIAHNGTADFGSSTMNVSKDVIFTVNNSGGEALNLVSFTISGTDSRAYAIVGTPPTSVGAGGSSSFTVRFLPTAVASYNVATLRIVNNTPTKNPYEIQLKGTGTAASGLPSDFFGYQVSDIAGGNILPFLSDTDPGVITDPKLTGIDKFVPVDIGFDFFFYEKSYSRCFISTTGLLTFNQSSIDFTPDPIPSANTPNEFIAPFWTDLEITTSSKILYKTIGAAPSRIFVVKYQNVKFYNAPVDKRVTFQVQLYETSNSIQVRYQDENPAVAFPSMPLTVGIESRDYTGSPKPGPTGPVGLQFKHGLADSKPNRPFSAEVYDTVAGSNRSILFTRPVVITLESKYQRPYFTSLSVPGCTTVLGSRVVTCTSTTGLVLGAGIVGTNIPIGAVITSVTNATSFEISIPATVASTAVAQVSGVYPYPLALTACTTTQGSASVSCANTSGLSASMEITGPGIAPGTVIASVTDLTHFVMTSPAIISDSSSTLVVSGKVDVGTVSLGLNPAGGTIYKTAIGSVQRFEAPEFIYLDKNFGVLSSAGQITDANPAYYRLVNDGYSIDGQVVQGSRAFFTVTLTRDVTVVWRWKLEYAAIVESGKPQDGNVNNEGRTWLAPGQQFSAIIDEPLQGLSESAGIRLVVQGYSLFDTDNNPIGAEVPVTASGYVSSDPISMTRPVRLKWRWAGQVRYRFDARTFGVSGNLLNSQSFIRIYASDGTTVLDTIYGVGPDMPYWINIGTKVDVGAFYRTTDRRSTLTDFQAPPGGNLTPIGQSISSLADNTSVNTMRLARTYTVNFVSTPTEIHWLYGPTVFRAEVPLGQSFDPKNPDAKLVPDLAVGGELLVTGAGPGTQIDAKISPPEGSIINGAALRWDGLSKEFFPVQPGSYRVTWPDASGSGETYLVEIVSAFPGSAAQLTTNRENEDGTRQSPPGYISSTPPMQAVTGDFPAFPSAHYRHVYDSVPGRRPPTRLDIDATDEWDFQDLPFAEEATAATTDSTADGVPFATSGSGRSVVLYSVRPNSDEIANGDLTKETLAVRVISSAPLSAISRDDSRLVLGRRALELGSNTTSGGAYGVIQAGGNATTSVDPGNKFVADFWLNAKGLKAPAAITLTGCATTLGSTSVTSASTSAVVPGMTLSGTNIPAGTKIASITNATTLVISTPATASGSGLSLAAGNKPVTVMTTGNGGLKVTLDEAASTATASYRGVSVTHELTRNGPAWRHYAVHVFTNRFFNIDVVIIDFYLDGVRQERGFVSSWFPGAALSSVGAGLTTNSLRFGVDAEGNSGVLFDNFRLFNLGTDSLGYLSAGEVRKLRTTRELNPGGLRGINPLLSFNFESAPTSGWFANQGTSVNVGAGPVSGPLPFLGKWAHTDLQEVATRIDSTLDNAGFNGSGYVLNAVSNYNVNLYTRSAEVGTWGPVFPVNHFQLFTDAAKRLEVAYYENPYLTDRANNPNVAWPYVATGFNDVVYPTLGKDKDKAIYIASRIGSEGVDRNGKVQQIFSGANYADLQIYHQSNPVNPGYNPNEEHALVAPSGRAALKVKSLNENFPNSPPLAAFALQRDINTRSSGYSSDPWVLVQVNNVITGEPEMAAYQVFKTRTGTTTFPRPSTAVVNTVGSGLSYEAASNPEDGFLAIDSSKNINFSYQFEYPAFAGDLLIPPYPLNLVIGNVAMRDARGYSLQVNGVNQRCLWRDVNSNAWVVSGNGRFFHQFFYPLRGDFSLPGSQAGTPVAWIPDNGVNFTGIGSGLNPVKVLYNTSWRSDYPKLKRGETLTYQGGEYFAESPGAKGLPALVAMAASEIVYDSSTPSMSYGAAITNRHDISSASARLMRPLDRRENLFTVAQMGSAGFTPAASTKVLIIAERWYFKELPGSLQKRFYFDSLAEKLVFRGRLNEKESGDPNLTSGPDPLNILEPNVLTGDEYTRIRALSGDPAWTASIDQIYLKSQNPEAVTGGNTNAALPAKNLQGVKSTPANYPADLSTFWVQSGGSYSQTTSPAPSMVPLDSFGVGSALVPNPSLLTRAPNGSLYVTIAENNRSELSGAPVSLHIIEIIPDRYRGAIKVIEGSDAFSEKITLQHNGEFGGNTGDLYYEWWIRDAGPLDLVVTEVLANGTLKQTDANGQTLWQEYIPAERASIADNNAKHLGLHTIVFEGRPDVVLADKLVLMRYRHRNEANWKLVPFEFANASEEWKPGTVSPISAAPFQWAGAANSPQLQADGSKRYIPQLVMGWVKRVLDRINPYEARYTDFFSNESPATYSSQIQIAGGPYAGKVALNPDKNVIENTGLIELYRTVLERARELSIDNSSNGNASDGINQALLLAATRLSVLYELLANEAYSDAQDNTINSGEDSALAGVASYTHAFQNMESDLQHEELALLRGTDFGKSYPIYNRIFWNYAKGLGEAAYNVNYNIYDVTKDGFINEDDARKLYPQGHGDAWGHYVSALDMHYLLLQHPGFTWRTRSELYSLMQNVLEVDFLDEKTFSRLGAARARAGRDIVRNTYRLNYTNNPNGQWQGYTDGADPARAWGVSEWAHRAGQSAHFDWAVANALLPEEAAAATPINNPENLDRIERSGSVDEIGAIAAGLHEIQIAMDEANKGVNPLGFDSDAMTFDIEMDSSHFEQIYDRATEAGGNALATLDMATQSQNKLRSLADDTDSLIQEAMAQDLDFRNRLIEIFGRPYDGTIGVGKAYPEGYLGPDTLLFAYLDKTKIDQIVPPKTGGSNIVSFDVVANQVLGIMNKPSMVNLYNGAWNGQGSSQRQQAFQTLIGANNYQFEPVDPDGSGPLQAPTYTIPYTTASKYAFQAPVAWGQRTSYGSTQAALNSMLAAEIELDSAIATYTSYIRDLQNKLNRIDSQLAIFEAKNNNHDEIARLRRKISDTVIGLETAFGIVERVADIVAAVSEGVAEGFPTSIGFSNDFTSIGRGIFKNVGGLALVVKAVAETVKELSVAIVTRDGEANEFKIDLRNEQLDQVAELEGMIEEFQAMAGTEQPQRDAIGSAALSLDTARQEYITAQAEGFRLLREREAYNKILAAKVQKNRYQDMVFRLSRNEAMSKYQSSFNAAARYAWLAARAYDYETSLDPGHSAAPGPVLDKIIKERQLGLWVDGAPQQGRGGLAEILAQLKGNFNVLKGQLGINNPQSGSEKISLRQELFRVHTLDSELTAALELRDAVTALNIPESQLSIDQRLQLATLNEPENLDAVAQAPASNDRWKDLLKARIVPNLNAMPEFVRHCRPFAAGVQPGIVVRFSTTIEPGKNLFGHSLMAGDHAYSTANFATKIASLGVWMDDYNAAGLATSPRAYLVPLGNDFLRTSSSAQPIVRSWSLVEQRIPTPFIINQSAISSPDYIPTLDGVDGSFSDLRRHGDFRIYHNNGDPEADDSELIQDSRLVGRSVWNSQWMLVIPGAGLGVDPHESLIKFADNITDIKLYFTTLSHQGQ